MAEAASLKKIACEAIDKHAADLRQLSKQIWENPEENFEEKFAHKVLTDFLEEKGFDVTRSWTLETAFVARSGNGDDGPCVGVICEYDALPEVGHACGHNLIAEAGAAAGIGIKAALAAANNKLGKLLVIGTPAEEGGGGKVKMIDNGCFKGVDFCMMVHPAPIDTTVPLVLARDAVIATYRGHAAHAAAFPWEGINALDAVVMAYTSISAMRQQMKPTWRVHSIIAEGGVKPNIIPDKTKLEIYLRAPDDQDLQQLKEKVIGCLEGAAKATATYQSHAESLGVEFPSLEEQKNKMIGSTDMGNVSHVLPSIHPIYSIDSMAVNHSYAFTAAANTDVAHEKTLVAAKSMAMTAIDLLCNKELREQAKKQFTATHSKMD
ncbi:predicted protein [Nematostella vectensis]|uniref:Peptidase M20 domain-containing protein 2 n=1 Tax=Nematostella vectensis TaxID=45351 RepID=A7SUT4_NEMVE|nr:predicted protein [Nematostella vectensis]|eukprot:XP_001624645.1 predicted protein [Nematostella vectensis]